MIKFLVKNKFLIIIMVEEILSKQKLNSEMIGKLINNFDSYSRKLEEKMKINNIFHDFDENLRKDLNMLV